MIAISGQGQLGTAVPDQLRTAMQHTPGVAFAVPPSYNPAHDAAVLIVDGPLDCRLSTTA